MKILVCLSKTPDTTAKIAFTDNNTRYDENGVTFILNPYDEWYALVRALELVEAGGGTVTIVTVGLAADDTLIRKGLAIGANDAVRINAQPTSAYFTAYQIAQYAQSENYDAIFLGKETIDYNGAEVGAMLAEMLDMPFTSFANHLDMQGGKAIISRDIEGGTEVVEVEGPFVLSAAKGLAEQRIANMRNIMMAKTKPLKVVEPVAVEDTVVAVNFELPPKKTAVKMIDPENMEELVRLLREEAKVI
ncbi:MAG TPA: electron transfer flavoprotein subunit beta/FixA family protein [Saprospiraceae bacterium]|nr:electron transfer flavoprotein subunit beta/FixA family protein [Saprospiraceae bacterium]HMQ82495.1 electron transfer flavoprotein subunit beta/FixA family protein [Saprospiraceae bacterium]